MFGDACSDRQDVDIEDDVGRGISSLLRQEGICPLADGDLPVIGSCLPFLVECDDY